MARKPRIIQGGLVYHVLNRASARAQIFLTDGDYAAFENILAQAYARIPIRILTYALMPNHFHLVLWPRRGQELALSDFMRWLQVTHTQRWHAHYNSAGSGHLYQGRFKSFPVQGDEHVRKVCCYVERNPLRAKLCANAQDWPWSGLHRRLQGTPEQRAMFAEWPEGTAVRIDRWLERLNTPESPSELAALRESLRRGRPFGAPEWTQSTAKSLNLLHTLRPQGRPPKETTPDPF